MTHIELADDLCNNLRGHDTKASYFVGREVNLGSTWLERGVPRADVLSVKPSYTRFCVSIYECKASRADFLADVNAGKWRTYLPFCHRLYFACPSGVLGKTEVPEECGLMVRGDNGWRTVKQSRPRADVDFGIDTLLGILITCGNHEINRRRWPRRLDIMSEREACKVVGRENAARLASLKRLERDAEEAKAAYEGMIRDVADAAGVDITECTSSHDAALAISRTLNGAGLSERDKDALHGIAGYLTCLCADKQWSRVEKFRPKVPDRLHGWTEDLPA